MKTLNIKESLTHYFKSGETNQKRIGVELEHFVLRKDGGVLPYYGDGVGAILKELSNKFERVFFEENSILGMANDSYSLTLEPGAQLEISINPCADIQSVAKVLNEFYETVNPYLQKRGARLAPVPVVDEKTLNEIELIPKKRYEYMDIYFQNTGLYGRYMMRGTTSAQVSIDYADEHDFVRKYRAAYIISPLLALLAADFETEGSLKRIKIWGSVDPARTAPPPDLFAENFGYGSYAEYIMNTSAIFVPSNGEYVYTGAEKIVNLSTVYGSDIPMVEHYLSMLFPDIRLKTYIEIRIADSMNAERTAAYGGFCAALMYNDAAIDEILERYSSVGIVDIEEAKADIAENAENAVIYGKNARQELEWLIALAKSGNKYGDFSAFTKGR